MDAAVSQNFQRLLVNAVTKLFDRTDRDRTIGEVQDEMLAATARAMGKIFGDLQIQSITNPLQGGAFYFTKGAASSWHYKNLSAGERAAFDLILDMVIKAPAFPSAVFCIDEPELHINTRAQGALLNELIELLPNDAQLWVATHSIGMMRAARNRSETFGDVAFIDLEGHDMDQAVVLRPVTPTRKFWSSALRVALADLADLVAPATVVLVEGRPKWEGPAKGNAEFDARCLRNIFAVSHPDTEFVSVGSAEDVETDKLHLGATTPLLAPGTRVIRVVDQDDRSPEQIADLKAEGIRVLGLRDLENYLLSDEAIRLLCKEQANGTPEEVDILTGCALDEKNRLLATSVERGNPSDDVKSISGPLYVWLKRELHMRQVGNTSAEFLRDTMTRYITPHTETFRLLEVCIFDA